MLSLGIGHDPMQSLEAVIGFIGGQGTTIGSTMPGSQKSDGGGAIRAPVAE